MKTILGANPEKEKEELNRQKEQISAVLRDNKEEISLEKALLISAIAHPLLLFLAWLIITVLAILGISLPVLTEKPVEKPKDIEFVITHNPEQDPINKNTKLRSDKNSRAGGKHDPNKRESEPEPVKTPSKPSRPQQQATPAPRQQKPKPVTEQTEPAPKVPPRPIVSERPSPPPLNPPNAFSVPVPKQNYERTPYRGGPVTSGPTGVSSPNSEPAPVMSASSGSSQGYRRPSSGYSMGNAGNPGNPSPGNPNGRPGVDALREPDFGPYMIELQRKIKRRWNPPRGNESKRVVLLFKVKRDGSLISLKMFKSSGVQEADQAAIDAVKLAAPFRPLPPEYRGDDIDIQFTFDYNVLGVGGTRY